MEVSHAELEKYHYQALKNPMYRMEGELDVLREEMLVNMPVQQEYQPPQVIPQKIIVKHHYLNKKESNIKKEYIYTNILLDSDGD